MVWDSRRVMVKENLIGDFSVSIRLKMDNLEEWLFSGIYGPHPFLQGGSFGMS